MACISKRDDHKNRDYGIQSRKEVLDAGVKIPFDVVEGIDNTTFSEEWKSFRNEKIKELLIRFHNLDVHQDPILDGEIGAIQPTWRR